MKKLLLICAAVTFASLPALASASPIVGPSGVGTTSLIDLGITSGSGSNDYDSELLVLQGLVANYNLNTEPDLATPTACTGCDNINTLEANVTSIELNVTGYEYIKLKWDGMWQFYAINGQTGPVTFQSIVFNQNNQAQALSHHAWFGSTTHTVPDGGSTLMLLGAALAGLGAARRFMRI